MRVIAVLLLFAAVWLYSCWRWPYTVCSRCKGKPKDLSPSNKHWGDCPRCGGSGKRVRAGRQLLDRWSKNRR